VISFLFLGFPAFWDKMIAVFCGFIIIFISFRLKPEPVKKKYSFIEQKNVDDRDVGNIPFTKSDMAAQASFDITKKETQINS